MLDIRVNENGDVCLKGRFDASEVAAASAYFSSITTSCNVDFSHLDYISSAGLGVLLATQQRLGVMGHKLRLIGMAPHVRLVFDYAGFEYVFEIE